MRKISLNKFITLSVFIPMLVLFCFLFSIYSEGSGEHLETMIFLLSVFGWFQFLFSLMTWWRLSGSLFSIYFIFMTISYLFTFGQCLMWGIGIHIPDEIGQARLYLFDVPSQRSIVLTQLVTLIGLLSFHTGAVMSYKEKMIHKKVQPDTRSIEHQANVLFQVCKIANIISTPLMFYSIARNIYINSRYGYGAALYNAEVVATQNNLVLLLRMMYIPSMFGMLIASRYKKKIYRLCYINFGLFMVFSLFAGDRGEWLFPLCLLLWMHHKYCKRIYVKRLFKYAVFTIVLLTISVAIRNSRSSGVTVSGFVNAIVSEKNPIVSGIFELGSSMRPTLIIIQHGWGIYPYGNSYSHALFGMVTEKLIKLYQPAYIGLSTWFSQSFIGISYGAGFSLVAEALMNFGPYGSIMTLFVLGMLSTKTMFSVEKKDYSIEPLRVFFMVSTTYSMIQGIRNTLLTAAKTWFFSTVLIMLLYYCYSTYIKRRKASIY